MTNSSLIKPILNSIQNSIKSPKQLEYFHTHQVRYHHLLKKILKLNLPSKAKILDIGCYPMHVFNALEKMDFDVHGISSKHEQNKQKQVKVLNIETDKLPFKDNHFDLILLTEVIEHLLVNPLVYLKEIKRILKPGGLLIITTINATNLKNRAKLLFGKNIYFSTQQLLETNPKDDSIYFRHNREYTLEELKDILTQAGLSIHQTEHFSAYTPFRKTATKQSIIKQVIKTVGYFITKLLPKTRDSIYIAVKK